MSERRTCHPVHPTHRPGSTWRWLLGAALLVGVIEAAALLG